MIFVVVSTIGMALNTMPSSKVLDAKGNLQNHPHLEKIEAVCIAWFTLEYFLRLNTRCKNSKANRLLVHRLAGAPRKCEFLRNGMNIIDVLAILPFFLELGMEIDSRADEKDGLESTATVLVTNQTIMDNNDGLFEEEEDNLQGVLQVFRVFKLARILKLAR